MARSPERGPGSQGESPNRTRINRRFLLKGAIAGAVTAYTIAKFSQREEVAQVPEQKKSLREQWEKNKRTLEKRRARFNGGVRNVFAEQVEKNQDPTFGPAQSNAIDADWDVYYQGTGSQVIQSSVERLEQKVDGVAISPTYDDAIRDEYRKVGVPERYLYLTIIESGFQSRAVSPVGAAGAFQFMPRTAIDEGLFVGKRGGVDVDERLDILKSAAASARYLKRFHDAFLARGASEIDARHLALYSYNGGFSQRYLLETGQKSVAGFHQYMEREMRTDFREHERRVRPAETLALISVRTKRAPLYLRRRNPDADWSNLREGMQIIIPSIDECGPVHLVQAGDTVARIVRRWGIASAALMAANRHISKENWGKLEPGLELAIPNHGPTGSPLFAPHVKQLKMDLLRGYIENLDYVAKFKAVTKVLGQ
jgi:Transglycosylase SLT domain/LysM domain